jgi:hypothetical protein
LGPPREVSIEWKIQEPRDIQYPFRSMSRAKITNSGRLRLSLRSSPATKPRRRKLKPSARVRVWPWGVDSECSMRCASLETTTVIGRWGFQIVEF